MYRDGMDFLGKFDQLPATVTYSEAKGLGVSDHLIYQWRNSGSLLELSRGVYRRFDAPETVHLDVIAVCKRAPRAVVCLISSLAIHELTDEIPIVVQLAVKRGSTPPHIGYPPTQISRFDARTFKVGVEQFEASEGEFVPIYNAARSVVDAIRFKNRIGDNVAYSALHAYLARRNSSVAELSDYAAKLGAANSVTPALQVLLS